MSGRRERISFARSRRARQPFTRPARSWPHRSGAPHMDGRGLEVKDDIRPVLRDAAAIPYPLTARWPWKRWRSSVFRSFPVAVCGRLSTNTTSSGTCHFGNFSDEEIEERLLGRRSAVARLDDQQRALLPNRVRDRDDGGFEDVGVGHRKVLDLDRGDPLAAGLDHVLRTVGQLHESVRVDRADVARAEPSVFVDDLTALAFEVARDDPVAAHLQLADRDAVVRRVAPVAADELEFDAEHLAALLDLHVDEIARARAIMPGQRRSGGHERTCFRHAPRMQQEHAEEIPEFLDRRARRRRPARERPA